MASRRSFAVAALTLATLAPTAASAERVVPGWPRIALDFGGENIVYSQSGTTSVAGRGGTFAIHRTESFRLVLEGPQLTARRRPGLILRTSAGLTTGGGIAGGSDGRHVVVATGTGFTPHVIFCCLPETERAFPVETSGRPGAPITVAATLDGPEARYVIRGDGGQVTLAQRNVDPSGALDRHLSRPVDIRIDRTVAIHEGRLAWVDTREPSVVKLATVNPVTLELTPVVSLPQTGIVIRVLVRPQMVVVMVRETDGRYRLLRADAPAWVPTEIWSGTVPPGPIAVGGQTVTYATTGGVYTHTSPGAAPRRVTRPVGQVVALATDGARVAILERRSRIRRGVREKRSVIRMVVDRFAPGAPS